MKFIYTLIIFIFCSNLQAQEHAWVYFKDKPNASSFLSNPLLMLTQKALDRRSKQNISVDETDVPVYSDYVETIALSTGVVLKARSRWMNAVHVLGTEVNVKNLINLSFVDRIEFANKNIGTTNPSIIAPQKRNSKTEKLKTISNYTYGSALNQTEMLGVEKFHKAGYDGKGLQIAVIDGGFFGVNTAGAFSHLLDANQENGEILGGYDFVNSTSDFYTFTGTTHGTLVLSTIGAIKENEFVGTAPKASYYLYVTEDANSETPLEESLWVQAAERADSLGVDIINTSLGYSEFDESKYHYTYADMDGETTFITRGANIAAEKGIVVVNSAGNSGNDTWNYITAPADAKNIIAVGAVNPNESITSFSSFGPSSDQRIKPETLAQGGSVYVIDENNTVKTSNGTSFSGPIIAGVTACLWQAYPEKTNLEIRQMVIENSEDYLNPTDQGGYGVLRVGNLLPEELSISEIEEPSLYITGFSNSKVLQFIFTREQTEPLEVQIFSMLGSVLENKKITASDNEIDYSNYTEGFYYLRYQYKGNIETLTFIVRN